MKKKINICLWLLFLGGIVCYSCNGGIAEGERKYKTITNQEKAIKIWNENKSILEDIEKGKKFEIGEYQKVVRFFEQITGIKATDEITAIGRLPSKSLVEDLKKWDEWYRKNKKNMYFNDDLGAIEVYK